MHQPVSVAFRGGMLLLINSGVLRGCQYEMSRLRAGWLLRATQRLSAEPEGHSTDSSKDSNVPWSLKCSAWRARARSTVCTLPPVSLSSELWRAGFRKTEDADRGCPDPSGHFRFPFPIPPTASPRYFQWGLSSEPNKEANEAWLFSKRSCVRMTQGHPGYRCLGRQLTPLRSPAPRSVLPRYVEKY